jgi:hypothetical protein
MLSPFPSLKSENKWKNNSFPIGFVIGKSKKTINRNKLQRAQVMQPETKIGF